MARYTIDELIYWLDRQDPSAKVLFVEGIRDSRFWSILVPIGERSSVVVMAIGDVYLPDVEGGERGRAIQLAALIAASPISGRVKFFLDADSDFLLKKSLPKDVIITDRRDFEAYCLDQYFIERIAFSLGSDPEKATAFLGVLFAMCRPIGCLRVASDDLNFLLPFQSVFVAHPGRVISGSGIGCRLDINDLKNRLFSGAKLSQEERQIINERSQVMAQKFAAIPSEMLIHGKDLVASLSKIFGVTFSEALQVVHATIASCLEKVREFPKLRLVENFVRS